ncbi:hypothetical protein HELRODRAFT_186050 [Helobdella robusta]|uniref:MAGUK p55 subfamily member 6 n=1 Tax=Helobdella robusta TaxID=6412 RepID=T1FNL6_HELRO|nr:hypothetical protein HELRODRAFT_186050 [Helobdella robusta]ESN94010.1 hypothetical protein HELRODRAFT_186050 [Helobdella robusta]
MTKMPSDNQMSGADAFELVCDNLNSPNFESSVGANEDDVTFLSDLLNNIVVYGLVQAHEVLEEDPGQPVSCDNIELLRGINDDLAVLALKNQHAKELYTIIRGPYFKSVIETHDDVASKNFEALPDMFPIASTQPQIFPIHTTDAIRMVGIRKNPDESLGITVRSEENGLVVARILAGNMIDKQGLLHVGDVIKEINGQEVNSPEQMNDLLKKSNGNITMKILPTMEDLSLSTLIFLKAHFDYDPHRDNLIPSREAGLSFKDGDILQVINKDDPSWWQAKKVGDDSSGLIPSQQLEEKRKAFVRPEFDYTHNSLLCGIITKKKKKMMYHSKQSTEFDKSELAIYEEVARMPPFQRKTLVLIGAQGVGRRTFKQRLIKADPTRFASVLPHTNSPLEPGEENGESYWHVTTDEMIQDIAANKFLEYGEYEGYFYGIKLDTVRQCVRSGMMCILDISPQALKVIKVAEFMPYVVFLAAPGVEIQRNMYEWARMQRKIDKYKSERDFRSTHEESAKIERQYKHYFDLTIVNDNFDETYNRLRRAIELLSTEAQWVPITWVY